MYYNSRKFFPRIKECLDKIYFDSIEVAGETWGRISALCVLSGHIEMGHLYESLTACNKKTWKAVATIFSHNINSEEHQKICYSGLNRLLEESPLCQEILAEVSQVFLLKNLPLNILHVLATTYLERAIYVDGSCGIFNFMDCLPTLSSKNPSIAFEIIKLLADTAERHRDKYRFDIKKELIKSTFLTILREADEFNDEAFIHAVISLQDRYLKMGIGGIETIYDQAG
jgi:hypothetical protein